MPPSGRGAEGRSACAAEIDESPTSRAKLAAEVARRRAATRRCGDVDTTVPSSVQPHPAWGSIPIWPVNHPSTPLQSRGYRTLPASGPRPQDLSIIHHVMDTSRLTTKAGPMRRESPRPSPSSSSAAHYHVIMPDLGRPAPARGAGGWQTTAFWLRVCAAGPRPVKGVAQGVAHGGGAAASMPPVSAPSSGHGGAGRRPGSLLDRAAACASQAGRATLWPRRGDERPPEAAPKAGERCLTLPSPA